MRSSFALPWLLCAVPALGIACNSFDAPAPDADGFRSLRIVPKDERPTEQAETLALPISGGTLLSLGSSGAVAASDPSRDQIHVRVRDAGTLTSGPAASAGFEVLSLAAKSQPGRMALSHQGNLAVVLRGTGEVASFDLTARAELWRTAVCSAPRGIAFDAVPKQLAVACAEGSLVLLDAVTGSVTQRISLPSDVRDVVAADGRLYVSRFRSAQVLFVENGAVTRTVSLPRVEVDTFQFGGAKRFAPSVAWRMLANATGGVLIAHQRAALDEVPVSAAQADETTAENASPYGGAGNSFCDGIVQAAVSRVSADGKVSTSGSLAGVVLPVDLAQDPDTGRFIVADAGLRDADAPRVTLQLVSEDDIIKTDAPFGRASGVSIYPMAELIPAADEEFLSVGCVEPLSTPVDQPTTAVIYAGLQLAAQQERTNDLLWLNANLALTTRVYLPGTTTLDTGHELFHRSSSGGIACASCHPEGGDDGHVWDFTGLGLRRTQNLAVPLAQTEPFHWDGTLRDVGAIMDEVFVGRMGGVFQSRERLESLEGWLFAAPQPVLSAAMDEAANRGKAVFESEAVGCATCHTGPALTDNKSYDVGSGLKGQLLQVPSLVGIAARPPFMHTGCAKTLAQRFDPECGGGDQHGHTSQLAPAELDDLVAYLRTL